MPPRTRVAHKPKRAPKIVKDTTPLINNQPSFAYCSSFKPKYNRPFEARPKNLPSFLQKTIQRLQYIANRAPKPIIKPKIFPIAGYYTQKHGYQRQNNQQKYGLNSRDSGNNTASSSSRPNKPSADSVNISIGESNRKDEDNNGNQDTNFFSFINTGFKFYGN